jgi:hypothetical protein
MPLRRGLAAGAAVALGCLLAAPAANAAFTVSGSASPTNATSGANSNFNVSINFGGGTSQAESVENLTVHLPPGLVGDPNSAPLCTVAELNDDNCPSNSQLGTVSSNVTVGALLPQTVNGDLYNLVPRPGEPARFGIVLRALPLGLGNLILQSGARLRKDDFGLDSVVTGIPNQQDGIPIHVNSQTLTLFGESPTGNAFLRNPTSCGTQTTGFSATSHGGESATGTSTFTLSGCRSLPFNPQLTAIIGSPGHTEPTTKPPLTTVIEQKGDEAGMERAAVILPPGIDADASLLGSTCPLNRFRASNCPANSIIGSAVSESPLLEDPLQGQVSIVESVPGQLPNLGVDLKGPLAIQLLGNFVLVPGPGNVFEGLPDIPISRFELKFDQDKLVLTQIDLCNEPVPAFNPEFTGHNGVTRSNQFPTQVAGCKPDAEVKLSKTGSKHPRMKATIKGGGSTLREAKVKLPRQLKFGKKKAVKRGAKAKGDGKKLKKSAVKAKRRKLTVESSAGAKTLKVNVRKKGLKRVKKIKKGKSLKFPIKVEDAGGFTTKLTPRAETGR